MKTVVLGDPPEVLVSLINERQQLGLATHDELWQGDYHMAPAANFQHGKTQLDLAIFLKAKAPNEMVVGLEFNLGDSSDYRVPDLGIHRGEPLGLWFPTAAVAVEVRTPNDETYEKFEFYFDHGVEELLVADLVSRSAHWFVRGSDRFVESDRSEVLGVTPTDVAAAVGWA